MREGKIEKMDFLGRDLGRAEVYNQKRNLSSRVSAYLCYALPKCFGCMQMGELISMQEKPT